MVSMLIWMHYTIYFCNLVYTYSHYSKFLILQLWMDPKWILSIIDVILMRHLLIPWCSIIELKTVRYFANFLLLSLIVMLFLDLLTNRKFRIYLSCYFEILAYYKRFLFLVNFNCLRFTFYIPFITLRNLFI